MVRPEVLEPIVRMDFETMLVDSLLLEDKELQRLFDETLHGILERCGTKRGDDLDTCIADTVPSVERTLREKYRRKRLKK